MNVRIASPITILSGFITRRIVERSRSRRISFIAIRFCDSRWMSANTAWLGSGMSSSERASGRAAARICRSNGNTLSIHQRATSGKREQPQGLSGRRAVDDDRVPLTACGGPGAAAARTARPCRAGRSALRPRCGRPRARWSSSPSQSWTPDQWRSISSWALTSWPQSRSPAATGSPPSSTDSDSDRLWAGRWRSRACESPRGAARAVLAATEVFPTPPLPV